MDQTPDDPVSGTAVTGTSYIKSVASATTHYLHVRTNCGNGNYSAWSTFSFTTSPASCSPPTSLTVSNITTIAAEFSWTAPAGYQDYEYMLDNSPVNPNLGFPSHTAFTGLSYIGLESGTTYYFHIRIWCSDQTWSDWTSIPFTTIVSTCPVPANIAAANITASSADISWTASSGATNYEYTVSPFLSIPLGTGYPAVPTNSVNLTGLLPATTYYLHVLSNCGGGNYSPWAPVYSFTTAIGCPVPVAYTASNITSSSAVISWSASSSATGYQYVVNTSSVTPSGTGYPITSTNSVNPTGLSPGTNYYVHVRTDCGGGDYSLWSVYQFTTTPSTCPLPVGFIATTVTSSSAAISWIASSGATSYEYLVNTISGPPSGTGYPTTSTNSLNPTGLLPTTTYYVHVRTDCGGNYSSWAQYEFITTASVGLEDEAVITFRIYPNPTKGLVHITSSAEGMVHVSVVDFAGKEVLALPATAQASFDLDLSGLESGVYFVKFLSDGIQETQRIVLTK